MQLRRPGTGTLAVARRSVVALVCLGALFGLSGSVATRAAVTARGGDRPPGPSSRTSALPGLGNAGSDSPSSGASPSGATSSGDGSQPRPGCPALAAGWVGAENAHTGTAAQLGPDADGAVLGYLDRGSAACGDSIGIHLSTGPAGRSRSLTVAAYRIGWYHGAGARLVWRSPPVTAGAQPEPSGTAAPHLVVPGWPVATSVTLTAGWLPGFYLLVPQGADGGAPAGPGIPLVVRDDGGHEPILMKASDLTWNAYSNWGGWSLYHGPGPAGAAADAARAQQVALHRPVVGSGYNQLTYMDLPVVRQLEQLAADRGIDVAYTTDVSVDAAPQQLLGHDEVVCGGHSEYWTGAMYDGLLAARDGGTNAAFLGANNLWWRARLEGQTTTGEPEREVVYRDAALDPDAAEPTIQWQHSTPSRDPAAVLGQSHAAVDARSGLQLLAAPAWFTAGTGLAAGQVLATAVGNEVDGYNPRAHNPPSVQVFAAAVLTGAHGPVLSTVSYSTAASGSAVFAAGSTDWACDPTGSCIDHAVPPATARAVGLLTRNVLLALATRAAGRTHPGSAAPPPTLPGALRQIAAAATGRYTGSSSDEPATRSG